MHIVYTRVLNTLFKTTEYAFEIHVLHKLKLKVITLAKKNRMQADSMFKRIIN
jgi:hypothetical protein